MKKRFFYLILSSLMLLSSCNLNGKVIVRSPNEDKGLEGNAENDKLVIQDASILKDFLLDVSEVEYYTYEITSTVNNNLAHFYNYFTPNAWYEDTGNPETSFGYAQEKDSNAMFKYYLNEDETEVIPSIYEYIGINENHDKLQYIYSPIAITHVNLLAQNMDEFSAMTQGFNRFLITDSNVASIFQYMTTYGASIINYIVAVYVEIIDAEELIFKSICDLGTNGKIEGLFTPTPETKINFVNDLVKNGDLKGVDYYDEVNDFLTNKILTNNYVLRGITQKNDNGTTIYPYIIHCTNNYFYLEYNVEFLNTLSFQERVKYSNYGYVLVPKGKEVTYKELQSDGTYVTKTQTLNYDACYGFSQKSDGTFEFDFFRGPIEGEYQYVEVDILPEVGKEDTLYIVLEDGKKVAYTYRQISDGVYDFTKYSDWFNTIGDFYINDVAASFYLGSTPLPAIGSLYFEKSRTNENEYYSNDLSIIAILANGLFGWGFQQTDTWMDYIENSRIRINKDENNQIISYEVCLDIRAKVTGSNSSIQEIYYTFENFGEGNVLKIEEFLNEKLGGGF